VKPTSLAATAVLAILLAAPTASAHIELTSPKPRHSDQKDGPCGVAQGDKRGTKVTTYKPGETITVTWDETVSHPGHFRISFDPAGFAGFVDPKSFDDLDTAPTVLVDNIKDKTGTQSYSQQVTLPDVECETCTLQLIQVMTDKPPYGDGNDLYYQCADITLSNGAPPVEEEPDAGAASSSGTTPQVVDDGGCHTSPTSGLGASALLVIATATALSARRRRKSAR